jgi:O-antigen/teichoic acid export membrane protein
LTVDPPDVRAEGMAPATQSPEDPVATEPADILDSAAAGPAAIRGSILLTSGYIAGMLMSILSVSLLIRHLGIAEYGSYAVVIGLVTIVQGVTDVGLGQIGLREFATRQGDQRERLLRNLLGVRIALTTAGVGLGTAFAAVAGYGGQLVLGTLLAGAGMVLAVIQGTFAVPLGAQLRLGWVTVMNLLRQTLTVAAIVARVMAGAGLLPFLAVGVPVGVVVLVATLVLVRGAMPLRPSFERAEWTALMRAVLPFAAAVAIGTLYLRSTLIMMPLLTTATQTGYYGLAYNVLSVLLALPALTAGAALPILARAARDDSERLRYVLGRLFEVTLIVGVWLAIALALGAGFVVQVLSGGKSEPAVVVIQIQSIALVTQFVSASWQYGLLSLHVYRPMMWISISALTLNVALTIALVPVLQANGAAIAFTAAEVVGAVASLGVLVHGRRELMPSARVPVRVLIAAAVAAAVALAPGLSSLVQAIIASALYLVVLIALRAIPPEILHSVRHRPRAARG